MDRDSNAVQVGGSFERRRGPSILVGVVGILVFVAVVKPWSFGGGGGAAGSRPPARSMPGGTAALDGAAVPPASAGMPDSNALACLAGDTEQLVLLERWADNEVRSWIAVASSDATGPLDTTIPTTTIYSSHVIGVGICPRRSPNGSSVGGARIHDVQRISLSSTGRAGVDLGAWAPITRLTENPEWAVLYGPAAFALESSEPFNAQPRALSPGSIPTLEPHPAVWPNGVYALGFSFPLDPTTRLHWLQVEIRPGAPGAG